MQLDTPFMPMHPLNKISKVFKMADQILQGPVTKPAKFLQEICHLEIGQFLQEQARSCVKASNLARLLQELNPSSKSCKSMQDLVQRQPILQDSCMRDVRSCIFLQDRFAWVVQPTSNAFIIVQWLCTLCNVQFPIRL